METVWWVPSSRVIDAPQIYTRSGPVLLFLLYCDLWLGLTTHTPRVQSHHTHIMSYHISHRKYLDTEQDRWVEVEITHTSSLSHSYSTALLCICTYQYTLLLCHCREHYLQQFPACHSTFEEISTGSREGMIGQRQSSEKSKHGNPAYPRVQ
jgi:hypothetical protein